MSVHTLFAEARGTTLIIYTMIIQCSLLPLELHVSILHNLGYWNNPAVLNNNGQRPFSIKTYQFIKSRFIFADIHLSVVNAFFIKILFYNAAVGI